MIKRLRSLFYYKNVKRFKEYDKMKIKIAALIFYKLCFAKW